LELPDGCNPPINRGEAGFGTGWVGSGGHGCTVIGCCRLCRPRNTRWPCQGWPVGRKRWRHGPAGDWMQENDGGRQPLPWAYGIGCEHAPSRWPFLEPIRHRQCLSAICRVGLGLSVGAGTDAPPVPAISRRCDVWGHHRIQESGGRRQTQCCSEVAAAGHGARRRRC